ncbi:MAG TPA: ChbG/HpnK family deacetylase [Pyrinomonadaceae bacterium]|nr:ChbG/HpnK family deacetylase [Pyrinomonadaceae bacterium]
MHGTRTLVVNADDFGLSRRVNQGVLRAHADGIVTSASLMVRADAAEDAVRAAHAYPRLGLGLHFDFGEWVFRGGEWQVLYSVVDSDDVQAVRREARAQLETFRRLTGQDPTHLDSHQHAHRRGPARDALLELSEETRAPLRGARPDIHYCGRFYGQTSEGFPLPDAVSADSLVEVLRGLPSGVTELCCHPGLAGDELATCYRDERAAELSALCDPRVRAAVEAGGIRLCSFRDLAAACGV